MTKKIIYKAPNGKLLKINFCLDGGIIKSLKIYGDFFVYPEDDLFKMEKALINTELDKVKETIENFLNRHQTQIVGFTAKDIKTALEAAN